MEKSSIFGSDKKLPALPPAEEVVVVDCYPVMFANNRFKVLKGATFIPHLEGTVTFEVTSLDKTISQTCDFNKDQVTLTLIPTVHSNSLTVVAFDQTGEKVFNQQLTLTEFSEGKVTLFTTFDPHHLGNSLDTRISASYNGTVDRFDFGFLMAKNVLKTRVIGMDKTPDKAKAATLLNIMPSYAQFVHNDYNPINEKEFLAALNHHKASYPFIDTLITNYSKFSKEEGSDEKDLAGKLIKELDSLLNNYQ